MIIKREKIDNIIWIVCYLLNPHSINDFWTSHPKVHVNNKKCWEMLLLDVYY